MNILMNNPLRIAGFVTGILLLVLTLGFVFQLPWVVNLWPWPDSRLSYLFLGSILAAVTVAVGWISWLGEWGALPAGALNVFVIAVTWASYFLQRSFSDHHSSLLFPRWHNAFGQLLSFLAYDLVLIFPFLGLFSSVKSNHRLSLIIYVAVLLYSGLLAIYYLLSRKTRGRQARSQSDEGVFTG